jgi:hypothetical protein
VFLDDPEPSHRPTAAIVIVSVILATALGGMVAYLIFGDAVSTSSNTVADASAAEPAAEVADREGDAAPKQESADAAPTPEPAPAVDAEANAVADLGKLPITGPAGAVLYVDGEKLGPLPTDASLPPGKHTLSIEAAGYLPWETEVDVRSGDNPPLEPELEAASDEGRRGRSVRKPIARTTTRPKADDTGSSTSSKPSPPKNATPEPFSKPGKPAPETPAKPAPSKSKNDDVFIKPGTQGKTKDDGIFLPVGNGQ